MALDCSLPVISEIILFVVILEGASKLFNILRHNTKGFILKPIDIVYSSYKVGCCLFYHFLFTGPVTSRLVKRDLVRNILYMVVKLPVAPVLIISTRFLDFRTIGERLRRGTLRLGIQKSSNSLG
jgi:hypothetical protein